MSDSLSIMYIHTLVLWPQTSTQWSFLLNYITKSDAFCSCLCLCLVLCLSLTHTCVHAHAHTCPSAIQCHRPLVSTLSRSIIINWNINWWSLRKAHHGILYLSRTKMLFNLTCLPFCSCCQKIEIEIHLQHFSGDFAHSFFDYSYFLLLTLSYSLELKNFSSTVSNLAHNFLRT